MRSRSGGISRHNTFKRKYKSSLNSPRSDAESRFDLLAARTRTFIGSSSLEPRRTITRSCNTRSNFICNSTGMFSISSRNRLPLEACSNLPIRFCVAPVNAPDSWPNNSLSIMVSGRAPQLTGTNRPSPRGLKSCNARATSSFPVPVSPRTRTSASVAA